MTKTDSATAGSELVESAATFVGAFFGETAPLLEGGDSAAAARSPAARQPAQKPENPKYFVITLFGVRALTE
jgi:hypothetical protein